MSDGMKTLVPPFSVKQPPFSVNVKQPPYSVKQRTPIKTMKRELSELKN